MGIEMSLCQKVFIKILENIPIKLGQANKVSFIIFIQNGIKRIPINLLNKLEINAALVRTTFS